jgi:glycosyltransferase involved in cell wall biosynthesis
MNADILHTATVSVAMATYNGEAYLREQIDSILAQTFRRFELIIIDDDSTDGTIGLLEHYREKDARIKTFFNKKNLGYRETFYSALSKCSGEYILFSDQDDIWVPEKINTLLKTIGDNLLVFSNSILINEHGVSLQKKLSDTVRMIQPGQPEINRGFVIGNCVWGHTIMFHHSLTRIEKIVNPDQPHDWWFAVMSSHMNKIRYCAEVLNYYRQHEKNLTQAVPSQESKRKKMTGRKQEEYDTQLSRLVAIGALPFNMDKEFYQEWHKLYLQRKKGFSFPLFRFLLANRKAIFCMKRKNFISQLISIRKMCRKVD